MSDPKFVHLHAHTEYSLLDGTVRFVDDKDHPSDFLKSVKAQGMDALAMTDHGNLYGAVEFYKACTEIELKPIVGCEVYMAPGARNDKSAKSEKDATRHLILLASSNEGYQNLMALSSKAFLEGYHYKPRIDKDLLRQHSKGLIALSGCLKSDVSQALTAGNTKEADRLVGEYCDILGRENFFIELMDHGLPMQTAILQPLQDLAKRMGLPVVATNDCHYWKKDDWESHDARVCISTGALMEETKRLRFETHEFYYKSAKEMHKLFGHVPGALENTLAIAERCDLKLKFDQILLPHFPVPEGETVDTYIEGLCYEGLKMRRGRIEPEYEKRLKYELEVIKKMGFSSYFLIVWDFIRAARGMGIPVGPGRGSGAGSVVAWTLDITRVDPLEHSLLFERFLNPDRISMPDLDIDFSDDGRERVIAYVKKKYGEANVAQIITFASMNAKAVVRDVGRVMNMTIPEIDKIAKLIPGGPGSSLAKAEEAVPELNDLKRDPRIKKLFELAHKLEGVKRHTGVHAAGTIITKEPVVNYAPLARGSNEVITTQYNDVGVNALGLLKVDFLGLRTLKVIHSAVDLVRRHTPEFDIEKIPFQDEKSFELLRSGHTLGVFQLDSDGMRDLLRRLKPTTFQDISAVLALYRPGPMESGMLDDFVARKHGAQVRYDHPLLKEVLNDTYGCMVYQEQIMEISKKMGGFTPGQADGLRKAMGKKNMELLEKQRANFVAGCTKNKVPDKTATKVFDQMLKFGGYGFNKCVVGDTRVLDFDSGRWVTVRELVASQRKMRVLSVGEDGKALPQAIGKAWSNGFKPVFKLRTALGKEIRATDNHPFLTIQGWRELGKLRAGDRIAVPRSVPAGSVRWPAHKAALLGWVLSEGNACHPSGFYVYSKDQTQAADMVSSAEAFENTATTVRVRRGLNEIYVRSADKKSESGAWTWLKSLGLAGKDATTKEIPQEAFELDPASLAVVLGRMWSGDGFVFSGTNKVPFYATSSRRMAHDLQALLLKLGIVSRVAEKSFKYRGGRKTGYAVLLKTRESVKTFALTIGPSLVGKDLHLADLRAYLETLVEDRMSSDTVPVQVRELIHQAKAKAGVTWNAVKAATGLSVDELHRHGGEKKGFRRWTLLALADYFKSDDLRRQAESDVYWDTVHSIEPDGAEETFDLEVPGAHNFLADGIFVHNSHTVAYAVVAWQTAYLKANYPMEFMAALLSSEIGHGPIGVEDKESKLVTYGEDARKMGLVLVPPDVQKSGPTFEVERAADGKGKVIYALLAIKNVGEGAVESIVAARKKDGPFKSLDDLCRRVDLRQTNRKVIESLIKAGAMDSLSPGDPPVKARARLLAAVEATLGRLSQVKEDLAKGQGFLFGGEESDAHAAALPAAKALSEHDLLHGEKEVLGFYLSGHPLTRYQEELVTVSTHRIGSIPPGTEGPTRLAGILTGVRRMITREKKEPYARAVLEDLTGSINVLVFPKAYAAGLGKLLEPNKMIVVSGRLSSKGDAETATVELIAEDIVPLEQALGRWAKGLVISLSTVAMEEEPLLELRKVLGKYPGNCPVLLKLNTPTHGTAVLATDDKVAITAGLFEELEKTLGEKTWRIESASS